MAIESRKSSSVGRYARGLLSFVGFITLLFGGAAKMADAFGAETVGPAAATVMLRAFGDPCDGVEHPAFQTEGRRRLVDAVQEYQGVNTNVIYAVEKVAVKNGWAYIETGPLTGPGSGEYEAFLLQDVDAEWVVKWNGSGGAVPGQGPKDNPYPEDFDSSDQDILRCQTVCVVGG
jgi:hypothetical protein